MVDKDAVNLMHALGWFEVHVDFEMITTPRCGDVAYNCCTQEARRLQL